MNTEEGSHLAGALGMFVRRQKKGDWGNVDLRSQEEEGTCVHSVEVEKEKRYWYIVLAARRLLLVAPWGDVNLSIQGYRHSALVFSYRVGLLCLQGCWWTGIMRPLIWLRLRGLW